MSGPALLRLAEDDQFRHEHEAVILPGKISFRQRFRNSGESARLVCVQLELLSDESLFEFNHLFVAQIDLRVAFMLEAVDSTVWRGIPSPSRARTSKLMCGPSVSLMPSATSTLRK